MSSSGMAIRTTSETSYAVITATWGCRVTSWLARRARTVCKPSISGMFQSISSRS